MSGFERAEGCDFMHLHTEIVEKVRSALPDEEKQYELAELFSMFGDTTRIRILYALFEAEMCVCDLANLLGMTQSAVSHQLALLKRAKLVKARESVSRPTLPEISPVSMSWSSCSFMPRM